MQDGGDDHYAIVQGIAVTAEGVETAVQRNMLQSIGCTELQGFLFSKPLDSQDTASFLNKASKPTRAA